jgi:hypothetical protein
MEAGAGWYVWMPQHDSFYRLLQGSVPSSFPTILETLDRDRQNLQSNYSVGWKPVLDGMFGCLNMILSIAVDGGMPYWNSETIVDAVKASNGLAATEFA